MRVAIELKVPKRRLLFVVTEAWYFRSHRRGLALAAKAAGWEVHIATRVNGTNDLFLDEGFVVHQLDWSRTNAGLQGGVTAVFALRRIMRRVQPDIVHNVALKPIVLGSIAARLAGRTCVLNAVAGLGFAFTQRSMRTRALRWLLVAAIRIAADRRSNKFLFQNDDDRKTLTELGAVARSSVALVRGAGVDLKWFHPMPEPASEPVTIAVVARMVGIKGVADVVAASDLLYSLGKSHRLILVGAPDDGNPASISKDQLKKWDCHPQIEWRGSMTDVRDAWREAPIAVLASHGGEGLPKTLLEAAACGRPIVATDVPGSREIARQGINALVVPPATPPAIAEALASLIDDPKLRKRFGTESRRIVVAEFSQERVFSETLALYDAMVADHENFRR